jgi:hypothetical protein
MRKSVTFAQLPDVFMTQAWPEWQIDLCPAVNSYAICLKCLMSVNHGTFVQSHWCHRYLPENDDVFSMQTTSNPCSTWDFDSTRFKNQTTGCSTSLWTPWRESVALCSRYTFLYVNNNRLVFYSNILMPPAWEIEGLGVLPHFGHRDESPWPFVDTISL